MKLWGLQGQKVKWSSLEWNSVTCICLFFLHILNKSRLQHDTTHFGKLQICVFVNQLTDVGVRGSDPEPVDFNSHTHALHLQDRSSVDIPSSKWTLEQIQCYVNFVRSHYSIFPSSLLFYSVKEQMTVSYNTLTCSSEGQASAKPLFCLSLITDEWIRQEKNSIDFLLLLNC
jgi:hypothetical protein